MVVRPVLLGLAAAAAGSISALLSHVASRWLARLRMSEAMALLVAGLATGAIYLLGLVPFMLFAPFERPLPAIIFLAWMGGVGLMRWWLR